MARRENVKAKVTGGINAFRCPYCKEGTGFLPVTLRTLAVLRVLATEIVVPLSCHAHGHKFNVTIFAYDAFSGSDLRRRFHG